MPKWNHRERKDRLQAMSHGPEGGLVILSLRSRFQLLFQPAEDVCINLLPVGFVQELMPFAGIQLQGNVPAASGFQRFCNLCGALTIVPHRVRVPCQQKHRKVFWHLLRPLWGVDLLKGNTCC